MRVSRGRGELAMQPHDDDGASSVEYGLIVSAIAAVITAVVFAFGGTANSLFSTSCDTISTSVTGNASCTP
jgi:Flp pilus assembly pilin Flp